MRDLFPTSSLSRVGISCCSLALRLVRLLLRKLVSRMRRTSSCSLASSSLARLLPYQLVIASKGFLSLVSLTVNKTLSLQTRSRMQRTSSRSLASSSLARLIPYKLVVASKDFLLLASLKASKTSSSQTRFLNAKNFFLLASEFIACETSPLQARSRE